MYVHTWKKYLPVLRILLKRSASAEQNLVMDRVDFEKVNKARKPLCAFSVDVVKGRVSPLSAPLPAKDLLEVMTADPVALDLLRTNRYHISLTNSFKLQIRNTTPVEEMTAEVQAHHEPPEEG
jgi:hypothetical protein